MQIDFHHGTIYVLARIAGFAQQEAEKLAYASQYTDDAIHGGLVRFKNGALFKRTLTAHKAMDKRNLKIDDNLDVWLPFHFLPGNGGNPKGVTRGIRNFIQRLVAKPNSPLAQDMIDEAIRQADKPYGLHRFGIALHVYADTWAHQGFAGIVHEINEVEDPQEVIGRKKVNWWDNILRRLEVGANDILDDVVPPIGHGRASILPDLPYITWTYTDGKGKKHKRNNGADFLEAARHIFSKIQQYLEIKNPVDLDPPNLKQIEYLFKNTMNEDGDERHKIWLAAISDGRFKIDGTPLRDNLSYDATEKNSWKYQAIGMLDYNNDCYRYGEGFLSSDWKCFHDAAMAHRFYVLHELLPEYGICAG